MRSINLKYALFTLALLSMLVACLVAFTLLYGRNLAWAVLHMNTQRHGAFLQTELVPDLIDEIFVRCEFLNMSFDLPSAMARNAKIEISSGTRFLAFEDGERVIRVVASGSGYETERAIFGTLPKPIRSETTPQLLHRIYSADSGDFSLSMSAEQLAIHDWAISYRNILGYENHMNKMSFDVRNDLHVLTLFANSRTARPLSEMKRLISWSHAEGTDGGLIYVFDSANSTGGWSDRVGASLRSTARTPKQQLDLAAATDLEIIAAIDFIPIADEPSDRDRNPD